jgi:hypothetical protein
MQNRVVSIGSLILVLASTTFFLTSAWAIMSQQIDEGSGILALAGCLLTAVVFSYRYADPKWLDPISIVKSR